MSWNKKKMVIFAGEGDSLSGHEKRNEKKYREYQSAAENCLQLTLRDYLQHTACLFPHLDPLLSFVTHGAQ